MNLPEKASTVKGSSHHAFAPIPCFVLDLIHQRDEKGRRKILPIDFTVLAILLRYRTRLKNSCWTTVARIAGELDCCERTVQRSLKRLKDAKVIRHVQVAPHGEMDPDEPRNRTGWRFYFVWLDDKEAVSPPPRQACHHPDATRVAQSKIERSPLPAGGRKKQTSDFRPRTDNPRGRRPPVEKIANFAAYDYNTPLMDPTLAALYADDVPGTFADYYSHRGILHEKAPTHPAQTPTTRLGPSR
jgi:hypothetical protein